MSLSAHDPEPRARIHLTIHGRVQGVGFREFTRGRASELGLAGWVRNLPDGSVELEAEGPRPALDQLLLLLKHGPRHAHVDRLEETALPAEGEVGLFNIL